MYPILKLPEMNQVKINDALWSRYTDMVAEKSIPYQWDILNDRVPDAVPTHCLDNFRIAAGEQQGEHQGVVFMDTDVYKWLETVAYCIQNGSGLRFESVADEVIELIGRAQQSDGYLNTYFTVAEPNARWTNLVEGHELYSAGYLIEAAVAYYKATGKDKLLKIARRFADLICNVFGPAENQLKGYPGHQEIELALVKLYRLTGEKRYLSCAKFFIDERGKLPNYFEEEITRRKGKVLFDEFKDYDLKYAQTHMPVREQRTAEGHAVRAMYMCCAMADIAAEYEDEELLEACRALWRNVTEKRMYITGGVGSSGIFERFTTDYHLPNDSAYCETCASIGLALFGRRMFCIEQNAAYYDTVERALYNTVLSGISIHGDRYFYVNPLEVWPAACMEATSLKHVKPERQRWFNVACCPTNVARTLASLGQYIYAQNNDTLYINLFISSSIQTVVSGVQTDLKMESGLMQKGEVSMTVKAERSSLICLAIRIPQYADEPVFLMDGEPVRPDVAGGYAYIRGDFAEGRTVTLKLNIKAKWISANPLVREDAGKVALMKGPHVYCLEETDNGFNLASVFVSPDVPVEESADMALPGNLPALRFEGQRLAQKNWNENRLYGKARFDTEPVVLKAVPYCLWGNRDPGEMAVWLKCRF
jgi:DUF1680 family protein